MIEQLTHPERVAPNFVLHPHIAQTIIDFKILLDVKTVDEGVDPDTAVTGELSLLDDLKVTELNEREAIAESFHRHDYVCVRTIVRALSVDPVVDFWVFVSFGHTADDRPIFPRVRLVLDYDVQGRSRQPFLPIDGVGGTVGHGQGLPIKHFRYDFSLGIFVNPVGFKEVANAGLIEGGIPPYMTKPIPPRWLVTQDQLDNACRMVAAAETKNYLNFEKTIYVPAFPGKTGDQEAFGCYHILPDLYGGGHRLGSWRDQLYMEGCRPGHFVHADGAIVEEPRFPQLVLDRSGFFHPHSKGFGGTQGTDWWFSQGDSDKNKMAMTPSGDARWNFWDRQHWGLGPLCQAFLLYSDPGLGLLIDHATEAFLWATPVTDLGPTHHNPGAARAIGRMWESGANLYWALSNRDEQRRQRLFARLETTIGLVLDDWNADIAERGHPWKHRRDGVAVWEHAIWVKGIAAIIPLPFAGSTVHDLRRIGLELCKFVYDHFEWWNEEGVWGIPYILEHDLTSKQTHSSSLGDWCVPALQVMDKFGRDMIGDDDGKLDALIRQYVTEIPQDRSGGWGERSEWRLW